MQAPLQLVIVKATCHAQERMFTFLWNKLHFIIFWGKGAEVLINTAVDCFFFFFFTYLTYHVPIRLSILFVFIEKQRMLN